MKNTFLTLTVIVIILMTYRLYLRFTANDEVDSDEVFNEYDHIDLNRIRAEVSG
ncbi:hypothetical protein GCM10007183_16880 [Staphylococcus muscae]|uniref:Phage protein n=1 Tax=Staphylococcus muscae TaxID=1294 RepID=A0ABQ1HX14_9STAP|nr:hypothetical protein GCM10007183_16880 [Staphylococcus muscae]